MLERPTSIEGQGAPRLSDMQRIVDALEAIATGIGIQISSAGQGLPTANVRVIPVSNDRPVRLASANKKRTQLTLQNLDAAQEVTLGHDASVVFAKGIRHAAGVLLSDDGTGVFRGEWWAIANVVGPVNIAVDDQG